MKNGLEKNGNGLRFEESGRSGVEWSGAEWRRRKMDCSSASGENYLVIV